MPRSLSALPLLLFLLAPIARADQASLPGCEAPSALRKAIKNQLESKEFRHLYFQLREERQQRVLSETLYEISTRDGSLSSMDF